MRVSLHPIIEGILSQRGITADTRENFLNPKYETLHDPFALKDMEKAVGRIALAISNKEIIAIYSDYDADGIPGGVMLRGALETAGAKILPYIPDRHMEGFGFHADAISTLKAAGVGLIITVDCGIAHIEGVMKAEEEGIDVIITDHHEPSAEGLPPAFAILNPKQPGCEYPFKELCGAGVAFKLVEALQQKEVLPIKKAQEKWLLDLVGLATIADMVPLVGENRVFARFGLMVLGKTKRPGVRALLNALRLRQVTEDDVAFLIAPRINAASRMNEARLAYDLLATQNENEADKLVKELQGVNDSRKGVVASMVKEAVLRIQEENLHEKPVIVIGSTHWRPSFAGLLATNLVEKYGVPVFVWGEDGAGELRGSCRSNGRVSVHELMTAANGSLKQFGGHEGAGGFTVARDKVHGLGEALIASLSGISQSEKKNMGDADAVLSLSDINSHFLRSLFHLKPFGIENVKPLFHFPKALVENVRIFGKTNEHVEVAFTHGSTRAKGISFFGRETLKHISNGDTRDIFGNIEEDPFRGRDAWRVRIVEVR